MTKDIQALQQACSTCPIPPQVRNDLCNICATQQMIRGKWKLLILWLLRSGEKRFSQLKAGIPNVKQGPLTAQLKELRESGLIHRKSFDTVPPHVEYSLTEKGKEFLGVMRAIDTWARENLFDRENSVE